MSAAVVTDLGADHYGRGMLDDDPFNQAFGNAGAATALELEQPLQRVRAERPQPARAPFPSAAAEEPAAAAAAPEPEPETAAQLRARRIAEIAAYGRPPAKVFGAPLYCARVMLRKRVLSADLARLSLKRKHLDDIAYDELKALGEELYALRQDPRLRPLAKLLSAVDSAEAQIGSVQAHAARRQQQVEADVARLGQRIERGERAAAPLREREAQLSAALERLKAELKRVDGLRRRAEAELEAAQKQKGGAAVERVLALQEERDARHGEVQTLGIQMQPIADELATLTRELDQRLTALAALDQKRSAALAVGERAEQNQRVSSGSARGARVQALCALATAAQRQGLATLAKTRAQAVAESAARAEQQRKQEELHRAAVHSYDKTLYSQGFTALMSGSVLFFVSLAAMVLF